jgi:predicted glutamate--cysteine ligase
LAREWIEEIYQDVWATAKKRGFSCFLSPLKKILREGNMAQQWLSLYQAGFDSRSVIIHATQAMAEQEQELEDKLCQPLVA